MWLYFPTYNYFIINLQDYYIILIYELADGLYFKKKTPQRLAVEVYTQILP